MIEKVYICPEDETVELVEVESIDEVHEHWCKFCRAAVEETGWFESNESN